MRSNTIAVTEALQASAGNLGKSSAWFLRASYQYSVVASRGIFARREGLLDTVDLEEEKTEKFLDTHQETRATSITQKELIAVLEDNEHEVLHLIASSQD